MKSSLQLFLALILPCVAYASGPDTLEEQIEYQLDNRAFQKSAIGAALHDADTIFTGRAVDVWKDHELRRIYVQFEIESVHRGHPGITIGYYDESNSARRLSFESDSCHPDREECSVPISSVRISSFSAHDKVKPFKETYRYLVYMEGDRIIRQNEYLDWILPMHASQELEFIEGR